MPQKVKGYYYHISQQLSPRGHVLAPKRSGRNRDPQEPDVPRICVCPTIAGCVNAVGPCLKEDIRVRVFKTNSKVNAVVPFGPPIFPEVGKAAVSDSNITKEKWLIRKTSFKFAGYINLMQFADLLLFHPGDPREAKKQRNSMLALCEMEKEGRLLIH